MKFLPHKRSAFTLIEVLIFLSIFSIFALTVTQVVHQYHQGTRILEMQSDTFEEYQFGMTMIKDEIKGADFVIKDFNYELEGEIGIHIPLLLYVYNENPTGKQTEHGYTLFRLDHNNIYRMKFYTEISPDKYYTGEPVKMGSYGLGDTGNTKVIENVDNLSLTWESENLLCIKCEMLNSKNVYKTWIHTRNLYNQ